MTTVGLVKGDDRFTNVFQALETRAQNGRPLELEGSTSGKQP